MMLPKATIKVSVIMPIYNEERYIDACIKSLAAQTYPVGDMEWILVDGGSTDNTLKIINQYKDSYPIKILINPQRKTPISMNLGIQNSRGEFIIRLDAHAEYPNTYIEKSIHYLETTDADNVGGLCNIKADNFVGKAIAQMLASPFGVGNSQFRIGGKSGYVDTVPFGAFHREVFEKIGLFNENLLRSEDNDFNARIRANGGKIFLADDIVSNYYCRDTIPGILKMGTQNGNALFRTYREDKIAMSVRHFVPFLFLLSLMIMPIARLFSVFFKWLFIIELAAYFLLDVFYSFLSKNAKYGVITLWLYPLFHIAYGIGSLLGLFGIKLY